MLVDCGEDLLARDLAAPVEQLPQVIDDGLPRQVDTLDNIQHLAVTIDNDSALRRRGGGLLFDHQQRHVRLLLDVAVDQCLNRFRLDMGVARGDKHMPFVIERLDSLGCDLSSVPRSHSLTLIGTQHSRVLPVHSLQDLLGHRADNQQETTEALFLEYRQLAVDRGFGIDFEADFHKIVSSHSRALAGGKNDDHRLLLNRSVLGHLDYLGGIRQQSERTVTCPAWQVILSLGG